MKIGICGDGKNIKSIKKTGADYIELHMNKIAAMEEQDFNLFLYALKENELPAECACLLFPKEMKLIGVEKNVPEIIAYLEFAFSRARALGIKICVFGSGKGRSIADGEDFEKGMSQLIETVKLTADIAKKYGIKIAIEPLNSGETNLLTNFSNTLEFAKKVDRDNCRVLLDIFHFIKENDKVEKILDAQSFLIHMHIACPAGRGSPREDDGYDYKVFFEYLKKIGYDKRISLECKWSCFETEAPVAIEFLRQHGIS